MPCPVVCHAAPLHLTATGIEASACLPAPGIMPGMVAAHPPTASRAPLPRCLLPAGRRVWTSTSASPSPSWTPTAPASAAPARTCGAATSERSLGLPCIRGTPARPRRQSPATQTWLGACWRNAQLAAAAPAAARQPKQHNARAASPLPTLNTPSPPLSNNTTTHTHTHTPSPQVCHQHPR